MKIKMTYTTEYDTDSEDFRLEYEESFMGYPLTFDNLVWFVKDRFINPNFDTETGGSLTINIVPEYRTEEDDYYA